MDQEKMKLATELFNKMPRESLLTYYCSTEHPSYFRLCLGGECQNFDDLDSLIAKLSELALSKSKYAIGDTVWYLDWENRIGSLKIKNISQETMDSKTYLNNGDGWSVPQDVCYESKLDLISAQLKYWHSLNEDCQHEAQAHDKEEIVHICDKCNEEYVADCQHESDGRLYAMPTMAKYKCEKCGGFYK